MDAETLSLISLLKNSNNPMSILQEKAKSDPRIAKALQMTQGKPPQQFMEIAMNLATTKGIDLNQMMGQFKGLI